MLAYGYAREHGARDRGRPALQHGRPAPDRRLRDGPAALRPPGARRRGPDRLRRRHAVALLRPRPRHGRRVLRAARPSGGLGRGFQHRRHERDHDPRARRAGDRADRVDLGDHASFPSTRPTTRGSRSSAAASPTPRRSRSSPGWRPTHTIDDAIDDVSAHMRGVWNGSSGAAPRGGAPTTGATRSRATASARARASSVQPAQPIPLARASRPRRSSA